MSYEVEICGFIAAAGKVRRKHPASQDCAEIIFSWTPGLVGEQRLTALLYSADLGHTAALDLLFTEVTSNYMSYESDKGNLSNAIHTLFRNNRLIGVEQLRKMILDVGGHNVPQSLVRMLARHGGEDALDELIQLRASPELKGIYDSIESECERLSGQLGITLDRTSKGLLVKRKP